MSDYHGYHGNQLYGNQYGNQYTNQQHGHYYGGQPSNPGYQYYTGRGRGHGRNNYSNFSSRGSYNNYSYSPGSYYHGPPMHPTYEYHGSTSVMGYGYGGDPIDIPVPSSPALPPRDPSTLNDIHALQLPQGYGEGRRLEPHTFTFRCSPVLPQVEGMAASMAGQEDKENKIKRDIDENATQEEDGAGAELKTDEASIQQHGDTVDTYGVLTSSIAVTNVPVDESSFFSSKVTGTAALHDKIKESSENRHHTAEVNESKPDISTETSKLHTNVSHIPISEATSFVAENVSLIEQLNAADLAALGVTLQKSYAILRKDQACAEARAKTVKIDLAAAQNLERAADKKILASYERAVVKLEAAQEAESDAEKSTYYASAVQYVREAHEHSQVASELRVRSDKLLADASYWNKVKMQFEMKLVDFLFMAVKRAIEKSEVAKDENADGYEDKKE